MGKHLQNVVTGKIQRPHLVLIYGVDGVGKSTFAAGAPKPIFVGSEKGTDNIDNIARASTKSWEETKAVVKELIDDSHDYKTLVVDSLDWCEHLVNRDTIEKGGDKIKSIEDFGYGKGYVYSFERWLEFVSLLDQIREKKQMNICLIAHPEIINFNDPAATAPYDKYQLKLHKKVSALFREYVDTILFANFQATIGKEGGKTRASTDDLRVLYTERRPGFDAKNRFGLPFILPFPKVGAWDIYANTCASNTLSAETLTRQIQAMLPELANQELVPKIQESLVGADVVKLQAIENRVRTIVSGQQ